MFYLIVWFLGWVGYWILISICFCLVLINLWVVVEFVVVCLCSILDLVCFECWFDVLAMVDYRCNGLILLNSVAMFCSQLYCRV